MESFGKELGVIVDFYGDREAERSGVPLISHIFEGIEMLSIWNRPNVELAAFCLHPIVQNDEDVDVSWSEAYPLACEYRDKANSYLCRLENDWVVSEDHVRKLVGGMSEGCKYMLLADKVQNQKDFLIHHALTHKRAKELEHYFNLWICFLLKEIKNVKPN